MAVAPEAWPGDVGVLVEREPRATVLEVLGVELVDGIAARHEVERSVVGCELSEELIGDARREALGAVESARIVVLRERRSRDEGHAHYQEVRASQEHDFSAHLPSSPSTHAPQTTPRACDRCQRLRCSSTGTSGFCARIQRQS